MGAAVILVSRELASPMESFAIVLKCICDFWHNVMQLLNGMKI